MSADRRGRPAIIGAGGALAACGLLWIALAGIAAKPVLSVGGGIFLLSPAWLRALALLPLLAPPLVRSLATLSSVRLVMALVARVLLVVMLVVALAQPARRGPPGTPCTVALVDVSDSISDRQLDDARAFVEALRGKKGELHLVAFAARPRVVPLPLVGQPMAAIPRPRALGDAAGGAASDLESAVRFAPGLCPAGGARAILLTDGNETAGDLLAEAGSGEMRGLHLDAHVLVGGPGDDVSVRAPIAPAVVAAGEPFFVEVEVTATRPVRAELVFSREGAKAESERRTVDLARGANSFHFRARVEEAGAAVFRVAVSHLAATPAFADRFAENDRAPVAVRIKGRPRILFVEGDPAAAPVLPRALSRDHLEVETLPLPSSVEALAKYDMVILSDVAAASLGPDRMAALEAYVEGGGGLLFAAGERVYGEGYAGTPIERLLPVRFEAERVRERRRVALVLAIDRSGSMQGEKLQLAREAARASAALLDGDDLLGVIAFDTDAREVVRFGRVRGAAQALADLDRLQASGGTSILPPLREAERALAAAAAEVKHVILLTDGQASYEGIPALCERMAVEHITVSAVGVGEGADKTLLSVIAARGRGRFYFTDDPEEVPQIFTRDTSEMARPPLVETAVRVRAPHPARVLDGVDLATAPPLLGYLTARAKPDADTLLATPNGEPILARRRAGLGQVAVWTSDVKNRWAASWVRWPGFAKLFSQLARQTMRPQPAEEKTGAGTSTVTFALEGSGPEVRVIADALDGRERFLDGADTTAEITNALDPKSSPPPITLSQTAPGRYEGRFAAEVPAAMLVHVVHRLASGATPIAEDAALSLAHQREYDPRPPDVALLVAATSLAGGALVERVTDLPPLALASPAPPRELRDSLFLLAALVLVIDVLIRRLPWRLRSILRIES